MELIIIMLAIGFVLFIGNKSNQAKYAVYIMPEKKCPPHQWEWQPVVDINGNKVAEHIVCKNCGPLSKSLARGLE